MQLLHYRVPFYFAVFFVVVADNQKFEREISPVSLGLSEIVNGLQSDFLVIFTLNNSRNDIIDDFIFKIHKENLKVCIFNNISDYFEVIQKNLLRFIETASLLFSKPYEIIDQIHDKNLAHRLSLFIFYWGANEPPKRNSLRLDEPLRLVIVTRPRPKALRVFYNQATAASGKNTLQMVNWYDGESFGLDKTPLLPTDVYKDLKGREFRIPVIHSPPWHFVNYFNNTDDEDETQKKFEVVGGRDHQLLKLLSWKMNFKYKYIDPPKRTQGASIGVEGNISFTGGLGMIQNRQAELLFGDVTLSWERRKAVEFSFFTLSDSGAFSTHAPKRLNEALAVLRPFKMTVWPFLMVTILLSGPIFYYIIVLPYLWNPIKCTIPRKTNTKKYHVEYLREITFTVRQRKFSSIKPFPARLFEKCVWFCVALFLKQSTKEIYCGYRARFLTILYWLGATYVLADVYSAQLTSQFARPAREAPIKTLSKLEYAMKYNDYKLFVERDGSSLAMLENSTTQLKRLYILMLQQGSDKNSYLINSVEEGVRMILNGQNQVILAGRETLYFNMKRFGLKKFQMSYKLFSKYSAVAVQIGAPFLNSLNEVLIHAFEGGLLDKITDTEYDKMSAFNDGNEKNFNDYENRLNHQNVDSDVNIQAINLRMLQGAFIALFIGCIFGGNFFYYVLNLLGKLNIVIT